MCHIFCAEHAMALVTVAQWPISVAITEIREKMSGNVIRSLVSDGVSVLALLTGALTWHRTIGPRLL